MSVDNIYQVLVFRCVTMKTVSNVFIVLGILIANNLFAQDDQSEESTTTSKERPSWSTGLPERQKKMAVPAAKMKPKINTIDIDEAAFGLSEAEKSDILTDEEEVAVEIGKPEINIQSEKENIENPETPVVESSKAPVEAVVAPNVEKKSIENLPEPTELPIVTEVAEVSNPVVDAEESVDKKIDEIVVEDVTKDTVPASQQTGAAEIVEVDSTPSTQLVSIVEDNISTPEDPLDDSIAEEIEKSYSWKLLNRIVPNYPKMAAREKLEGWVDVEVTVGEDGAVVGAAAKNTSRRGRVFVQEALNAVKKWRFQAPSNAQFDDGQPLSRVFRVKFVF